MRCKILILLVSLICTLNLSAQDANSEKQSKPTVEKNNSEAVEDEIFMVVDQVPKFPGGEEAMMRHIFENIKYPPEAKNKNISGMCVISFVVEKDGRVNNAIIAMDIGGGCGAEALRVVEMMPKWNPGIHRGEPARVRFNLPVNFRLQNPAESKQKKKNRRKGKKQ